MIMFKKLSASLCLCLLVANAVVMPLALAATAPTDQTAGLSLEVSPAPIVQTVKPGEQKTLQFSVFNGGLSTEDLKIELQSFKVDKTNGKVTLQPGVPPEVSSWITFEQSNFSLKPGERVPVKALANVPATAGFSYNFAMVISRQKQSRSSPRQSAIQGSVAVFTLLNVDRPGAVRKLAIDSIKTSRGVYEYLPATLTLRLKNTGNSLLLPAGNAYIQRQATSLKPLSVLNINPKTLYLLPGVTREYAVQWTDGVPVYVTTQDAANAAPNSHLEWHWRDSQFRIGRYVAHVVVIYNDGYRDTPLQADVTFWVLPWKIILGVLVAASALLVGIFVIIKSSLRSAKRYGHKRDKYKA